MNHFDAYSGFKGNTCHIIGACFFVLLLVLQISFLPREMRFLSQSFQPTVYNSFDSLFNLGCSGTINMLDKTCNNFACSEDEVYNVLHFSDIFLCINETDRNKKLKVNI